jgi:hypothetical protein
MDPYTTFPIGIVANGSNFSNNGIDNTVNTDEISASVQLNSVDTDTAKSGASLQLNAVLHVITTNETIDYWTQNVLQIYNTDYKTAGFVDNIWKTTSSNEPMVECVKIPFSNHTICKKEQFYYRGTSPFDYQLPFSTVLVMIEKVIPQKGIQVEFMHIEHGNTKIYDQRMLTIPNIVSASFLTTSDKTMANHLLYDAEFVWGGKSNGEIANFTSMDSILNLQYHDIDSNSWKPFPSYFTHGFDTGETAQNIYSTIEMNFPGYARISLGNDPSQNNPSTSIIISNEPQTSQSTINTHTTSQPICFLNGAITDCSIAQSTPQTKCTVIDTKRSTVIGCSTSQSSPQTTSQPTMATILHASVFQVQDPNSQKTFGVRYTINGGTIKYMTIDPQSLTLIVTVDSTNDGSITLQIPRSLMDSKTNSGQDDSFISLIDGAKVKPQGHGSNSPFRTITLPFREGDSKISIVGTQAIPEFGSIIGMIIVISVIVSLVLSRRFLQNLRFT